MYNKRHVALMLLAQGTDRILRSGASLVMLVTQLVIALVLSPVLTVLVLVLIAGRSIRAISYQPLALFLPFSKRVADAVLVRRRPFQSRN
jgi:hypothetical protein